MDPDENGNINCSNCTNCYNCINCINCSYCYNCSNCSDCSYFDTCENCQGGGEYAVNCKNCIISQSNVIYVQNNTIQEVAGGTCSSNLYSVQQVFQTQRVSINPNCIYTSNTQLIFSATEQIEYLEVTKNGNVIGDINFFNNLSTNISVTYQSQIYSVPLFFNIVEPDENGNVNCTNCTNCLRCWNCVDCNGCEDCKNCNNCTNCWECMNLQSCSYYDNCVNCSNGDHCIDCSYLSNCNSCVYLKGSVNNIIQSKTGEWGNLSVNLGEIYVNGFNLFDINLKYTSHNNNIINQNGSFHSFYEHIFILNPNVNFFDIYYNGLSKNYYINYTQNYAEPDENGNINCSNCVNCYQCVNCVNCEGCENCINCEGCRNCYNSFQLFNCENNYESSFCSNSRNCNNSILCNYIDARSDGGIFCYNVTLYAYSVGWKGPSVDINNYDGIGPTDEYDGYGISSNIYNVFELNINKYINIHPIFDYYNIISLATIFKNCSEYVNQFLNIPINISYDLTMNFSTGMSNINETTGVISYFTNYTQPTNIENINVQIIYSYGTDAIIPLKLYLPDENNNINCETCYNCTNCKKCNHCSYCINVSNSNYLIDCTNCKYCNTCIYLNDKISVTNSIGSGIYILGNKYYEGIKINNSPTFDFTSNDGLIFTGTFNNGLSVNRTTGVISGKITKLLANNKVNIQYNNTTFTIDLNFPYRDIYTIYLQKNNFTYKI